MIVEQFAKVEYCQRLMMGKRLKIGLAGILIVLTLLIIVPTAAFFSLQKDFEGKLDAKKFLPTTEYYAAPRVFSSAQLFSAEEVEKFLRKEGARGRDPQQILMAGDYIKLESAACLEKFKPLKVLEKIKEEEVIGLSHCFGFVPKGTAEKDLLAQQNWILLRENKQVLAVLHGYPLEIVDQVALEPPLLAQYNGGKPIMQKFQTLSEVPPQCLNAIMSIEDVNFLEHSGFSVTGILRAFGKNILTGKKGQGGSTITQQLVKNYFLTQERSYKRKAMELAMAILLESKYSKDEILEAYLNIIYMGQNGPFQVIGYGAAAPFYFGKSLGELNVSECALLAAILNGPGVYDPWNKKEKAVKRRTLVLTKMRELGYISEVEFANAQEAALPLARPRQAAETAPYYIDAARKELIHNKVSLDQVKIYTNLNLELQQVAQDALQKHLLSLETTHKNLKEFKAKGKNLEGMILAGDPRTGEISVAVGGRSFRMTQFNRVTDAHRQSGSIVKPFVYLTALSKGADKYHPLTQIVDQKFEIKYEGQTWSPENYSKKYYGQIPLFYGLKNSLNASTAAVGLDIGLEKIIDTMRAFLVTSPLKALPSLTLGAFELVPTEVITAYAGLSQMGQVRKMNFVQKVVDAESKVIYQAPGEIISAADPVAVASLVSMMRQTLLTGTAHSVKEAGFLRPAAGKTGTTSDFRDAWFAGFTPLKVAVVWIGYDDNTPTKLTGGSGAIPVWLDLMKQMTVRDQEIDFSWPAGAKKVSISGARLAELGATQEVEDAGDVELVFRNETSTGP